jgi:UDP-3-O-[3-hydroxymyristoyl] glucosamine N-acyltransferase
MKLGEIAARLGCTVEGDAGIEITGVAGVGEAEAGQLTFLSNPRYRHEAERTRASALLIAPDVKLARPPELPALALVRSKNPYLDFARAIEYFYEAPRPAAGVHPTAVVAPSAKIGSGARIGPYCFVDEGVVIGRDAVLHSFVSIYRGAKIGDQFLAHSHAVVREYCRIGNNVILQNGAVVGSDGFGFARQEDGSWYKMRQSGAAVIEDDVEIQANACVNRATVGETRLRRGAKLDDLVLVGHGCVVGEDTLLCGQVGLAGSTRVGKGCILAGQAGAAGHLAIGDGAILTAQTGVPNDVPAGATYSGYPGIDNKQWLKNSAALSHLPELLKTVRELRAEVERLRAKVL